MQTLHITCSDREASRLRDKKNLMLELYNDYLKEDPLFHFFYEPDIIIRISSEKIRRAIIKCLIAKKIEFVVYDYPLPTQQESETYYGEEPDGIVIKNLTLFLPIFHAHSVAALTFSEEDHHFYTERVIHTLWNPKGYTREAEGLYLATLAEYKLNRAITIAPLKDEMFSDEHVFSYKNMLNNREELPIFSVGNLEYSCLFNGGWLRIRTQKSVDYHILQARMYHLTPDWKLHFSIANADLGSAWNIIGNLFLEKKCEMGMKMKVPDYDTDNWPLHMYGREITVYIYQHQKIYEKLSAENLSKKDQRPRKFWLDFLEKAEERLKNAGISSRGTANGDKKIGIYCSLRNESFVEVQPEWTDFSNKCTVNKKDFCYPPNIAGFNGSKDANPLKSKTVTLFFKPFTRRRYGAEVKYLFQQEIKKIG